jgi:tetratricopeptide (TPR) repeat protein
MKPKFLSILLLTFAGVASSAESRAAHDAGLREYAAGDFKSAVSHFQGALRADPSDVDSCFWLGKSYGMLADIGGPVFGTRASSKARLYLARALRLAPRNVDYRRELFDFLVMADHSPGALRQAEAIIQMTPESDPDYPFMLWQLHRESQARSSPENRVLSAFSVLPQEFARLGR